MASTQPQLSSPAATPRREFLTKLKPVCVSISRLSMTRDQASSTGISQLITLTSDLYSVLDTQVKLDEHVITPNDAEYVFVPLSFVFQRREAYPARLLENAVRCLRLMIRHGWRTSISAELARQLLILLTFLIGGVPGGSQGGKDGTKQQETASRLPEETILESFRTLTALFEITGRISASASPFVDTVAVPTLLQTVSVVLDGVTEAVIPDIRLEALETLKQIFSTIRDREALGSFLPGTVSSVAKILSPPESMKSQRRVLIKGLDVLKRVLINSIGDMKVRSLLAQIEYENKKENAGEVTRKGEDNNGTTEKTPVKGPVKLTPAWLKATTAQIKIFLAKVLKLRNHDAADVLQAVGHFCTTLLDDCHRSLSDCVSMLVESALIASDPDDGSYEDTNAGILQDPLNYQTNLQTLAMVFPELTDTINLTVYDWITNLPRAMQSGDEGVKHRAIRNLVKGSKMLKILELDSTTIQDTIAISLRDSMVVLTVGAKPPKAINESRIDDSLSADTVVVKSNRQLQSYHPVMLAQEGQKRTREEFARLISSIGSPSQQVKLAAEMLSYVQDSDGVDQVSSYWLCFQLLQAAYAKTTEEDALLDLSSVTSPSEDLDAIFAELYAFSVSTLVMHSDAVDGEVDWRLEAIALEVTTFAASLELEAFRPELIDVLYPVATFLGSSHPQLRSHAVLTLNNIAAYCGYGSVSELIIDNVDYMVNSVSLRLNTFDISPASTKVLTMMIHLTGPKILPYLDDVVTSIFAALDNYHGYQAFVESLFAVLSEVVTQGVKSDVLLLEDGKSKQLSHRKHTPKATTTEDTCTMLSKQAEKRKRTEDEDGSDVLEKKTRGHPKRPWKSEAKDLMDKLEAQQKPKDENDADEEEAPANDEIERTNAPKTPTYALLGRITTLTQHYLTSPAPTLRKSLLDILTTVTPALAPDEDAFLPLVNAIWPVLITRLYDPEPYVSVAAADALGALCAGAGDFMASRIKTEWGDGLQRWCTRAKKAAAASGKGASNGRRSGPSRSPYLGASTVDPIVIPIRSVDGDVSALSLSSSTSKTVGALGQHAQSTRVWEAAADLLAQVVSHVRFDDEMFDAMLELLMGDGDAGLLKTEYAEALEAVNADAVWLALYRRGRVELIPTPEVKGSDFAEMSLDVEA